MLVINNEEQYQSAFQDWMLDRINQLEIEKAHYEGMWRQACTHNDTLRRRIKRLELAANKKEVEHLHEDVRLLKKTLDAAYRALLPFSSHSQYVEDSDAVAVSAEETEDGWEMIYGSHLHDAARTIEKMKEVAGERTAG